MQTESVLTTVRVGNHTRSAEEVAAGAPDRLPYVDENGDPVDPDTVRVFLGAPDGTVYTFAYPTIGAGDEGLVQQESTGRFYVDWTPAEDEDGLWAWVQTAGRTGSSVADQDVFFVKRPPLLPLVAAPA